MYRLLRSRKTEPELRFSRWASSWARIYTSAMSRSISARALLAIEDDAVKIEAAKLIVAKGMSVRQTEALAVSLGRKKEKEDKKPAGIDYLALAAKQLEDSLGRRVKMTEGKNGGKIEIDYYDADDREALMDALRSIGNKLPRKDTEKR